MPHPKIRAIGILAALAVLSSCTAPEPEPEGWVCLCAMTTLLANPDEYDGKIVRTEGVASIGFERDAIWLSREHYEHSVLANSIPIVLPSEKPAPWPDFQHLEGRYVLVEGRFRWSNLGTTDPPGTIVEISRIFPTDNQIQPE